MPSIKSHIINGVLSLSLRDTKRALQEAKRRLTNAPHVLTVYIAIDDPYSFLLLQVLPELQRRFNVTVALKTVLNKQDTMFPEPEMWDENILNDAQRLAELYGLDTPAQFNLNDAECQRASFYLLSCEKHGMALEQATALFKAVWRPDSSNIHELLDSEHITDTASLTAQLQLNERTLLSNGHYLSGVVHYAGEWYWGLERLVHLEARLNALLGVSSPILRYNKLHQRDGKIKPSISDQQAPLEVYFSIRSPYSYLGIVRAMELAEHCHIELVLKPVLPMVMRGLPVPKQKRMYIAFDTKREAMIHHIPFGLVADPLGKAVERCYALFDYARSQNKQHRFIKTFATAVWSQGVDAATDTGLQTIVEASGLEWEVAKPLLQKEEWRHWAKQNLDEMYALGMWGVPSFKYQEHVVFGQDKLAFIEKAIVKSTQA